MPGSYDPTLVVVSVFIALLAAYAGLVLAARVAAAGERFRAAWLLGGAAALGVGVWSTHFVGVLAPRYGAAPSFSVPLVALSALLCAGGCAVALHSASRRRRDPASLTASALIAGLALGGAHYVLMAALRMPARIAYDPASIALSAVLSVAAVGAALWLAARRPADGGAERSRHRAAAAAVIGGGLAASHYVAMTAARVRRTKCGWLTSEMAIIALSRPGPSTATSTSSVIWSSS